MQKIVLLLMALLSASIYAAAPVSGKIGPVAVEIEEGSMTDTVLKAVSEPFTEAWLVSNPIAGKEKAGAVDILDTATGAVYSFIFRDGKIASCYPSYSAASPEL